MITPAASRPCKPLAWIARHRPVEPDPRRPGARGTEAPVAVPAGAVDGAHRAGRLGLGELHGGDVVQHGDHAPAAEPDAQQSAFDVDAHPGPVRPPGRAAEREPPARGRRKAYQVGGTGTGRCRTP